MTSSRTHRIGIIVLSVGLLLPLMSLTGGCGQNGSTTAGSPDSGAQSLPTVTMTLGSRPFKIEVAATEAQQSKGLMFRDSMPADHGMIFVFPDEQPRSFWMENTRIPLDIIYCDANGKIVAIKRMKPLDRTSIESGKPAKYAIELNPGMPAQAGLHVGDVINIPADLTSPKRLTPATAAAGKPSGNPASAPAVHP